MTIDLYWLPLGAGGHCVRANGKSFEWTAALLERRDRCDLYHSALQVYVPEGRFVVEQAPAWGEGSRRGVAGEGAVGARVLGRFSLFRYEIRCWREGSHPRHRRGRREPRSPERRPRGRTATPRARPGGADTRLGTRRAGSRRDVELELDDLVAAGQNGARRRIGPPPARRTRPGLACGNRRRAPAPGRRPNGRAGVERRGLNGRPYAALPMTWCQGRHQRVRPGWSLPLSRAVARMSRWLSWPRRSCVQTITASSPSK